jgi:hypothetical protein
VLGVGVIRGKGDGFVNQSPLLPNPYKRVLAPEPHLTSPFVTQEGEEIILFLNSKF